MNVNEFDKYIRSALENLEAPLDAEHWHLMEKQLDQMANGTDMSNADLDNLAKENLQHVEVPFNATHWALMEEQLNASPVQPDTDISDEQIDQLAYQALANQEIPYDPTTWDTLSDKLDRQTPSRASLIRAKTAEALLILLALLTMMHFMYREDIAPAMMNNNQDVAGITTPSNPNTTTDNNDQNTASTQIRTTSTKAGQSASNDHLPFQNTQLVSTQTNEGVSTQHVESSETGVLNNGNTNTPTTFLKSNQAAVPPTSLENARLAHVNKLPGIQQQLISKENASGDVKITPLAALSSLSPWRIAFSAGPVIDRIYTPADPSFSNGGEDRTATNVSYEIGVTAELSLSRFTVGGGLFYLSKEYIPQNRVVFVGGSTHSGWVADISKKAEINAVSIPLQVNYDLYTNEAWNLYATAGIRGNVVLEDNFVVQRDYCYNCGPSNPTGPGGGTSSETLPEIPNEKGLLQGGRLSDNLWFSGQFGFGLERKMTDNNLLFIQPTYQHFIGQKGVGLHKDRFNSLSILAGVKVAF